MLVVGLTGSIGMGKSTAAARFRHHAIPVFDADAEVHRLYGGPLVAEIAAAFPGTIVDGRVDRARLAAMLLADTRRFRDLEAIVHPRVREGERAFLQDAFRRDAAIAVLEIPLLFEVGGNGEVDVTVVVSAPEDVRRQRMLARPEMTSEKLDTILARQFSEVVRCRRADFVVDSGGTVENCNSQIDAIVAKLPAYSPTAFDRVWRQ